MYPKGEGKGRLVPCIIRERGRVGWFPCILRERGRVGWFPVS